MKPDNPYAWTPRKAKTKGSRFKKRYLVAAVEGGKFTLERGIEAARDGFTARMKRTEIGVQYMSPMQQRKGFLDKVFNRGKQEPQMYQGERQGR